MNLLDQYWFWLAAVSVGFLVAERIAPWRPNQPALRPGLIRDIGFLVLNGHFFALWTAALTSWFWGQTEALAGTELERTPMNGWSLWLQFAVFLVAYDFLDWCVHNLLHRVPFLWQFHKVHHSLPVMDWIGNFHFHWVEIVVYKALKAVPLALLGCDPAAAFWVYVLGTAWGHFNHSNLRLPLGPLGYVFNSPAMHLWHHDASREGGVAKNFGVVFSLWDHLLGTAFWPRDRSPTQIGYPGVESMPPSLWGQLAWPLVKHTPDPRPPAP